MFQQHLQSPCLVRDDPQSRGKFGRVVVVVAVRIPCQVDPPVQVGGGVPERKHPGAGASLQVSDHVGVARVVTRGGVAVHEQLHRPGRPVLQRERGVDPVPVGGHDAQVGVDHRFVGAPEQVGGQADLRVGGQPGERLRPEAAADQEEVVGVDLRQRAGGGTGVGGEGGRPEPGVAPRAVDVASGVRRTHDHQILETRIVVGGNVRPVPPGGLFGADLEVQQDHRRSRGRRDGAVGALLDPPENLEGLPVASECVQQVRDLQGGGVGREEAPGGLELPECFRGPADHQVE